MEFARLEILYVLSGALLLLAVIRWKKKKRHFAHTLVGESIMASLKGSPLRFLPGIFFLLALLAAGIALLEPQIRFREGISQLEGLDIVLVVDLSASMHETLGGWEQHQRLYDAIAAGKVNIDEADLPETRMKAVQKALLDFISKRKDDRVALVTFSENSYVVSPFTTDRKYLEKYVRMLDPNILIGEGMTAIGEGLATAVDLFRRSGDPETKNKVIVVFTDGEHNYGRNPLEVLSEARFYGYRVYLIGVELAAQIQEKDKVQRLIQAVRFSGGQYFDARDITELQKAYTTIDRTEKAMFVQKTLELNVPVYHIFVFSSLALLFAGLLLNSIPYFIEIS